MGEQFIDLFTAGAYALVGRLYGAFSNARFGWIFYLLAAAGIVFAIVQSALERRPDLWLRHMAAVCLAAVITLSPRSVDITELTYAAPGQIEKIFGTHLGAAPHLTYWIERLGASAAVALRSLTHQNAFLAIPGVAAQVADITADPASINDRQLKANLEIWRRRIAPQLLAENAGLAQQIQDDGLVAALLNPTPLAAQFVGTSAAARAQAVQALLNSGNFALGRMVIAQSPLINQIAHDAGAQAWTPGANGDEAVSLLLTEAGAPDSARRLATSDPAYDDAMQKGDQLLSELRLQLPQAGASASVTSVGQLYDLLGRSLLFSAGRRLSRDTAARATLGSLCQRAGDAACRSAMAPLVEASTKLRVVDADRYNSSSWATWVQQPITTTLLTLTSLMLATLSSLVLSVLPFALGVAKSMAILISVIGTWMLLWPGRERIALSWMVGPISFVSLWSVLFNIWSDLEPGLTQIATAVSDSYEGSYSARRLMSIAISLGYMGLPSLALGVVYGESGRALYHASARLENALLMAWHTRGAIAAFGRRWIVNSPMVRRWNQRAYRAIGMGPLRAPSMKSAGSGRARPSGSSNRATPAKPRTSAPRRDPSTPDMFANPASGPPAKAVTPRKPVSRK
jgi:hypothetical protein